MTKEPPEGAQESLSPVDLVQPLYLDLRMLTSFVAALEGGISYESEVSRRLSAATHADRERAARLGIPAIASFVGLGASAKSAEGETAEDAQEVRLVRTHTAASLFNVLRDALVRSGSVQVIDDSSHIEVLGGGKLVQFTGKYFGNPLDEVLAFVTKILPFVGLAQLGMFDALDLEGQSEDSAAETTESTPAQLPPGPQTANSKKRRQQARRERQRQSRQASSEDDELELPPQVQAIAALVNTLSDDLHEAAVIDVVMRAPGIGQAVVTLDREYVERRDLELLRGSRVTVLGKVTAVHRAPVNLLRRSAFAIGGEDVAQSALGEFRGQLGPLGKDLPDATVDPPALQIMPLAIYV